MPGRNGGTNLTLEKFTGKERDTEVGLNLDYFGARYYDPAISRFSGVDPLAGEYPSWNPYHYVLNNPVANIDPTGKYVVRGTTVTRVGRNTAIGFNVASFTLPGAVGAVSNRYRINDPSFSNSELDYLSLGIASSLRASTRLLKGAMAGISHADLKLFNNIRSLPEYFLTGVNSIVNTAADAFVGDIDTYTNIVIDEAIFGASSGLMAPGGDLLGELSAGGTMFSVSESVINKLGEESVNSILTGTFERLDDSARAFINERSGFDITNERHQRALQRHLQREVRLINSEMEEDEYRR